MECLGSFLLRKQPLRKNGLIWPRCIKWNLLAALGSVDLSSMQNQAARSKGVTVNFSPFVYFDFTFKSLE